MKLGFGKAKQKDSSPGATPETLLTARLRDLCGGDVDLFNAMSRLMFLEPKKIMIPLDTVLSEAQEFEGKGNKMRAEVGYRIAGGISLYRGDLDGVNKYFSKAASFANESHSEYQTILKRSSEAVAVARKYYEEFNPVATQA
jgi:hypothetical protein